MIILEFLSEYETENVLTCFEGFAFKIQEVDFLKEEEKNIIDICQSSVRIKKGSQDLDEKEVNEVCFIFGGYLSNSKKSNIFNKNIFEYFNSLKQIIVILTGGTYNQKA